MGDEKVLQNLKLDFVQSLKDDAKIECREYHLKYLQCIQGSIFNSCFHLRTQFEECWRKRLGELKEENKELLHFQIDPDKGKLFAFTYIFMIPRESFNR